MRNKYKPIIAIDFDMTISNNVDYTKLVNPPMPGAVDVIRELRDHGCILILWTCRNINSLEDAKEYLAKYGILDCFDYFNENTSEIQTAWADHISSPKIYADVYIDDKNVGMSINWYEIRRLIVDTIWDGTIPTPKEANA